LSVLKSYDLSGLKFLIQNPTESATKLINNKLFRTFVALKNYHAGTSDTSYISGGRSLSGAHVLATGYQQRKKLREKLRRLFDYKSRSDRKADQGGATQIIPFGSFLSFSGFLPTVFRAIW